MKKHKPRKPKLILPDDETDDDEDEVNEKPSRYPSSLSIGDINIVSHKSLGYCKRQIKSLLKDKEIKNYLGLTKERRMMKSLSYID